MIAVGAYSDRGRVKAVDQDACCFLEAQTSLGTAVMAIVCDGVGGLASGELASATVVNRFAQWFSQSLPTFLQYNSEDTALAALQDVWATLLQATNDDIRAYGEAHDLWLGTTFTGMFVLGGRYLIGHVGDCRAYAITNDALVQLTDDQTFARHQLALGLITPEEAAVHPKRHMIMQSVGTQSGLDPVFITGEFDLQAVYLLCCDGIHTLMTPEDVRELLSPQVVQSERDLQAGCSQLAWRVLERGEHDNVTALAFCAGLEGMVADDGGREPWQA